MKQFKKGSLVKPSSGGRLRWSSQVDGVKKGIVLASIFDGTKEEGGMPYRVKWDNEHINTYNLRDIEPFNISLENK